MGPFANTTFLNQTRNISGLHDDFAYFINSSTPWFKRGGNFADGLDAGMFSFTNEYGRLASWISFRLVLTPS